MPYYFDREGETIENEVVHCTQSVSIGGGTYYKGRVSHLTDESVADAASGFGVKDAAFPGGSSLDVYLAQLPSNTSECMWDIQAGHIYTTTSRTVYVKYRGYEMLHGKPIMTVQLPFLLVNGADQIHYVEPLYRPVLIYAYSFIVLGNSPASTATLALHDTADASGSSTNLSLTTGTAPYFTVITELGTPFKLSDEMAIKGDGVGANVIVINLYGEL